MRAPILLHKTLLFGTSGFANSPFAVCKRTRIRPGLKKSAGCILPSSTTKSSCLFRLLLPIHRNESPQIHENADMISRMEYGDYLQVLADLNHFIQLRIINGRRNGNSTSLRRRSSFINIQWINTRPFSICRWGSNRNTHCSANEI